MGEYLLFILPLWADIQSSMNMFMDQGVSMKKFGLVLAMLTLALVFGLALVGCKSEPEEPGILTVTNITSDYNGKYVWFRYADDMTGQTIIWGSNTTGWSNIVLTQIKNGSVDIPLKTADGNVYEGTETLVTARIGNQSLCLFLYIFDTATLPNLNDRPWLLLTTFPSISFTNGRATVSFATTN